MSYVILLNVNKNETDTKNENYKNKSDEILNYFYYNTRIEKERKKANNSFKNL